MEIKTNAMSREANAALRMAGIPARAVGDDFIGTLRIRGDAAAAESVLHAAGFQTRVIGRVLMAQK